MKKIYYSSAVALISLFAFVSTGTAQIRLGAKGGIDVINNKLSTDILKVSNRLGYYVGGTAEFLAPGTGLGAEVSILYGRREFKIDESQLPAAQISNYDYISVPLSIKKRFGITSFLGIFVSAGGFADIKIDGGNISVDDVVDKYKSKDFQAGINAGAGVRLLNNFDLGMYYRTVLTDNFSADDPNLDKFNDHNSTSWSVGLSYYF